MKWITLALLAVLGASPAQAQIYAFHSEIQGIYWNPELPGWGFSFDVQKGTLFGAVYGYDNQGDATFYTLISAKADGNNGLDFAGDIFQTNEGGSSTENVGTFQAGFGRNSGQPALSLTMDTPSLDLNDFLLVRFIYAEADDVGLLSGTQVRTWFGTSADTFDQNGTAWSFANTRQQVDGANTVDVLDDAGNAGFALLSEAGTYAVFFPLANNQTLTYDFDLLNDRGGQGISFTMDDNGNMVGDFRTMAANVVALDESSTKEGLVPLDLATRRSILASYGQFLLNNPRNPPTR